MPHTDSADSFSVQRCLAVTAAPIVGFLLFVLLCFHYKDFDPSEAGLGFQTVSRKVDDDGYRWCFSNSFEDAHGRLEYLKKSRRKLGLWLGASQLYAINDWSPGERIAVAHADQLSAETGQFGIALTAMPNGNFNEMLVVLTNILSRQAQLDFIIVGLVFDDLREPGIRESLHDSIPELSADDVSKYGVGIQHLIGQKKDADRSGGNNADTVERATISGTPQEHLEQSLTGLMDQFVPGFSARNRARAAVEVALRREVTFTVGSILNAAGLRKNVAPPIPSSERRWNHAAFESILKIAEDAGIRVLLYQAPHPQQDGPFYYDRGDYEQYFSEIAQLSQESSFIEFRSFEDLVPLGYWGLNNAGDLDPFHFEVEGHRLLGSAVHQYLSDVFQDAR